MRSRDLIALVLSNLRRTRGRVVLTGLGVVIGVAAVVTLISLGAGLQRQALRNLGSAAAEIRITGGVQSAGGETLAGRTAPKILDGALLARIEALPGVAWVVAFEPVLASVDVEAGRQCERAVRVVGVEPETLVQVGLGVADGVLALQRGQAVLGARVAERLGDAGKPGETLHLYLARFGEGGVLQERLERVEVSGILAPRGALYDFSIYIPQREALALNTWFLAQRRDPARQGYPDVLVKAVDVQQAANVEGRLTAMGLNVFSDRQQAEQLGDYFAELQAFLGGIAAISLLAAAFSIANTMLMAVYERTREIGLMKAIGATNRDVTAVFLGEAGCIGLLGGVLGVALGLAVNGSINLLGGGAALVRQMYGSATSLRAFTPLWLPFFAVGFAVCVGLISGFYPARRAAAMTPLSALKLG